MRWDSSGTEGWQRERWEENVGPKFVLKCRTLCLTAMFPGLSAIRLQIAVWFSQTVREGGLLLSFEWIEPELNFKHASFGDHGRFKVSSVQCAWKSPYALHPVFQKFPQRCFETVSVFIWLTTAVSHPFKGDSRVPPLSISLLQAVGGMMSLALCQ